MFINRVVVMPVSSGTAHFQYFSSPYLYELYIPGKIFPLQHLYPIKFLSSNGNNKTRQDYEEQL
jgi:hypothetical protein